MSDFVGFQQAGLDDAGYEGSIYTWRNNQEGGARIWQRLDRFLVNGLYKASQPLFTIRHLCRALSDHSPLVVEFPVLTKPKGVFHFQKMWLDHSDFLGFVKKQWGRPVDGSPLDALHR